MVKSAKSPQIHSQAEVRAAKAEAALEEVKKDFDTYREEKCAHEKMLSETLESTRTELSESRLAYDMSSPKSIISISIKILIILGPFFTVENSVSILANA